MIRVEKINKCYGEHVVLKDLDLSIPKGQIVSIIGPNGSGKSTLMGTISRTLNYQSGLVWIDSIELEKWDSNQLAKHLSIMKQSENIDVKITVNDLVAFGRFPHSKGRLNEKDLMKIEDALQYFDLVHIRDCYINELSGGQKQRAYIASIFAQDTDYILLDEPLNSLDIKYASDLLKLLRQMADTWGKTIILVIHDINFASTYSDYIILLKDGKVAQAGAVDEIMKAPVLKRIYDLDFKVIDVDGKKICTYY